MDYIKHMNAVKPLEEEPDQAMT
jgi:hypothetical protein